MVLQFVKKYLVLKTIDFQFYFISEDKISNYKLFGSYVLPEKISLKFEKNINSIIKKNSKKTDMILVCDYGHNFISDYIAKKIKKTKKFIYVNAQINAANIGYHTINKYHGVKMTYNEIAPIIERLDIIQKRLDKKHVNRYLSINEVCELTSLSASTLRRAVRKSELKCSRKLGKLLFLESDVRKWING